MKKSDPLLLDTHIRSIEAKDFTFIRSLAAQFPAFTVPSEYVLWLFTRYHPDCCRVLEQGPDNLKAYLLAMPTSEPQNGIAIWQVAAATPNYAFALEYFAAYLRDLVDRRGVTSLLFTAPQDPPSLRLIQSLAKKFADCEVEKLSSVPARQGEYEFRLSIQPSRTKSGK